MQLLRPLTLLATFSSLALAQPISLAEKPIPVDRLQPSTLTILSDLNALNSAVQNQIAALSAFVGGPDIVTQLDPITLTSVASVKAMLQTISDIATLPPKLGPRDGKVITDQLERTLQINNPRVCALLQTKRPLFDLVGIRSVVLGNLNTLQSNHLLLSGGLIEHMDGGNRNKMENIAQITTDALDEAIAFFQPEAV
jgi:hypothetical protein